MIICIICGLEFEGYNNQKCCSKKCFKIYRKEYNKKYHQDNKGKINKRCKEYNQDNKEEIKEYYQKYYEDNKEELNKRCKEYYQTPKGKEITKRTNAKRRETRKHFKFNPLNTWFGNSEAHHINCKDVINIPKELHQSIPHSIMKNKNMEPINTIAFFFLIMQNLDKLIIVYK